MDCVLKLVVRRIYQQYGQVSIKKYYKQICENINRGLFLFHLAVFVFFHRHSSSVFGDFLACGKRIQVFLGLEKDLGDN